MQPVRDKTMAIAVTVEAFMCFAFLLRGTDVRRKPSARSETPQRSSRRPQAGAFKTAPCLDRSARWRRSPPPAGAARRDPDAGGPSPDHRPVRPARARALGAG